MRKRKRGGGTEKGEREQGNVSVTAGLTYSLGLHGKGFSRLRYRATTISVHISECDDQRGYLCPIQEKEDHLFEHHKSLSRQ